MSISHAEFLRSLEPLGKYYSYRIDDSQRQILLQGKDQHIEIRLGNEQRKQLGALELPVTTVEFRFDTSKQQDIESFLSRFDLCFRRGGG
ncbi:MAG: hypothetical protein P8166_06600 [Candidatus Thiodiazotropha sp.]